MVELWDSNDFVFYFQHLAGTLTGGTSPAVYHHSKAFTAETLR